MRRVRATRARGVMAGKRVETQSQFHARMTLQCEKMAETYDRCAAACTTEKQTERLLSKAGGERRNADLHRAKLAEPDSPMIG